MVTVGHQENRKVFQNCGAARRVEDALITLEQLSEEQTRQVHQAVLASSKGNRQGHILISHDCN